MSNLKSTVWSKPVTSINSIPVKQLGRYSIKGLRLSGPAERERQCDGQKKIEIQTKTSEVYGLADLLNLLPFCFRKTFKVLNCFCAFIICRLIGVWSPAGVCHRAVLGRSSCIMVLFWSVAQKCTYKTSIHPQLSFDHSDKMDYNADRIN